jgi:hypothetical protein
MPERSVHPVWFGDPWAFDRGEYARDNSCCRILRTLATFVRICICVSRTVREIEELPHPLGHRPVI